MANAIPRPEHPNPQLMREDWMNLNGVWMFEIDNGNSGRARGLQTASRLNGSIRVPFCPESELSTVGNKDFMAAVWYTRTVEIPAAWRASGRVLLHFGAVDYTAEVWVNGVSVGIHKGGYSAFTFDVTDALTDGVNRITLCAQDDVRSGKQPAGKQSDHYESYGCSYTRTTGIWQTVWMEHVADTYVRSLRVVPDVSNGRADVTVVLDGAPAVDVTAVCEASYEGVPTASASAAAHWRNAQLTLSIPEPKLWEVGCGRLYDLTVKLVKNGEVTETVHSYFGMRDVDSDGTAIRINGKIVFQRLILDQGFFPDGIYTARDESELKADIERSMAMGFNGARLHQRVFEPRYLYWADKLGYLCWGEHANWRLWGDDASLLYFLPEWEEVVERDFSHPSIIGWCPYNETFGEQSPDVLRTVYETTRRLDPTRPVIDTSGWDHVITDLYDTHDYAQDPAELAANHAPVLNGEPPKALKVKKETWNPKVPYFVSEFGGTRWSKLDGWGYGDGPKTEAEFLARYEGLVSALLANPKICAFCYTQLTDVEQEQNGLYTYERVPKFDPNVIAAITRKPAAIEQE